MELIKLDRDSSDIAALEKINEEAIPLCERNSLTDLMDTGAEVTGIYHDSVPSGFIVLRRFKDIVYLAYLAVRSDLRNCGLGGKALAQLTELYKEFSVVVEFEAPSKDAPGSDINMRRKAFYLRNGFYETGWYTFYDDTEFEIGCSKETFDADAFAEFTRYLSTIVSDHIPEPYRK